MAKQTMQVRLAKEIADVLELWCKATDKSAAQVVDEVMRSACANFLAGSSSMLRQMEKN